MTPMERVIARRVAPKKPAPKKPAPKKPVPKKPAPKVVPKKAVKRAPAPAPKKPAPKPAPKKPSPKVAPKKVAPKAAPKAAPKRAPIAPKAAPKVVPLSRAERLAQTQEKERAARLSEKQALRAKRLRLEALKKAKREEKREANTARQANMKEFDAVKLVKKTMLHRYSRAKLMAHAVATRFTGALKSYIEDNKHDQAEIGWLSALDGHTNEIDFDFTPNKRSRREVVKAAAEVATAKRSLSFDTNDAQELDLTPEEDVPGDDSASDLASEDEPKSNRLIKLSNVMNRAITHGNTRALPTKKFGAASDVAGFFGGQPAVAIGFTLGRLSESSNDRLGIAMGSNFTYSTSHDAEDAAINSEYIKAKFFRKLNLVKFVADPRAVLSSKAIQLIKGMNGLENGRIEWSVPLELWGEANQNGKVGDPDNGVAGGLYFGVYKFVPNNNFSTANTYIVFGFWGIVGMKLEEMQVATYSAFTFNEQNTSDLATSCLGNLLVSNDPMIEHRELSLRAPQNDPNQPAHLVKNSLGYFIVAPNVDRRSEFPDFEVTGTLPKLLTDPDTPHGKELMKQYAGRIVYVDFKSKMIHYYTKDEGRLRVRMFNDAAELNNYDFVDLHSRAIAIDRANVKTIVDYLEEAQAREDFTPIPGVNLSHMKIDWDRALLNDPGMSEIKASSTITPPTFPVSIEMLRTSYNADRLLYNLVLSYYNFSSRDSAVDLAKGYTFIGDDDDDDLAALAQRMAIPQLGVMLHSATLNESDFPKHEVARERVESMLDRLDNPNLDVKFPGLGKYLNERGTAEFFKLKPHQVRAVGMADQLEKGVLDIDMGGGKTLISILLIIRKLEMLKEKGVTPRALIVMPDALITNFYREIKKFTARDPKNVAATARLNVVTMRNANIKMRYYTPREEVLDNLKGAPDNTLFIASYSYLGGARNHVKILTGDYRVKRSGEIMYKAEYMFPVVEDLLNEVGINVVFLDESHKIKNNFESGSYAHKACMALSRVKYKFIMTGTFVSRTPQDMFNQVKFIDPTMLGSIADFKKRYTLDNGRNWNHEKLKELRAYIQRRGVITMRREEWLYQMPPKLEKFHFVDFKAETPIIYKIYETLWDATAQEFPAEFTEALGGKINNDGDSDDTNGLEDLEATDTLEDEEAEIRRLQDQSNDLAGRMRSATVAGRLMALRALVSAPERFPIFTEAFKKVQERMSFNVDDLLKGPKDEMVLKLVREHFAPLRGHFIPISEQTGNADEKIGKIIIMSDRALIAQHMLRILREAGFSDKEVVYYDASHREHLQAFCDPESKFPSIMCAVENSIKEGVNMQSASRVIRLTVPWTTGDYDQSIARAFRTGQNKQVIVDNVLATSSFEPAMVARLVTRENVNKKVTSDFDSNEFVEEITINPHTAGPTGTISSEYDLRNYAYGPDGKRVDLIGLHDRIYQYETKMSKVWKASYLLKLVDTKEQMERNPDKCVWKDLDRRSTIVYDGDDFIYDRIPEKLIRDQNTHLENQIVYVDKDKKRGWMYIQDERRSDMLRVVKLNFYQLENANERHEDRDIAGSNKLYEPWATAGIHPEEMAVPMTNEVSEEEIEHDTEKKMRGIGQDDPSTTLKQKIIRYLRAAINQGMDPKLDAFANKNKLTVDNKLVVAIHDAVMHGKFHDIFVKSKAVAAVYQTITKAKYNIRDGVDRLTKFFKHNSKAYNAKQEAVEQARTGRPVRVTIMPEPGKNERTLGGPARRDQEAAIDLEKLQVAIGDQNGIITLVVPATAKNPNWKKVRLVPGYKVMKNSVFFPITSQPQINSTFRRIERAGGNIVNVDEFDSPEFKKVMRVLAQPEKPDQTASVSVYQTVTAARGTSIDLAWITMDKKLLIVAIDVSGPQRKVLLEAGFRPMQPYLWKAVDAKTIAREVRRLSSRVDLRNPITLSSRVLKLLKVRLPDRALGTDAE